MSEITFEPATVVLANGTLINYGDKEVMAKVEVRISGKDGKTIAQEMVMRPVAPGGEVKLIDREISYRMPQHGQLKLTLLEPGPRQWETFTANVWGGVGTTK